MSVSTAPLGKVAEINPRFDRDAFQDLTELASFVPMARVSEESGAITQEEFRPVSELLRGFTPFDDRDVLVAKITPCFENGKIAHARISMRTGFGSTEFHVLRPHAARLNDRYLFHFLRLPRIRVQGEMRMTGSGGQRRVPKAFLEELLVPLPALPEQRRIAAILDKADALRAKRREAIGKLDQLLQSVFLEMLGNPLANDRAWELMRIGDVCSPKQWPTITGKQLESSGYPVYGANGVIGFYSSYNHETPTVLVTCRGATCGTINVCEAKSYVTGNAMALDSPDGSKVELAYLETMLRMRGVDEAITGAAQPQITREKLSPVLIPVPPMSEQIRFARASESITAQKASLQTHADAMERLFSSLQHRAFAGTL